jgi:hypothetical protein
MPDVLAGPWPTAREPGIARWPVSALLPEPWLSQHADDPPLMRCELCRAWAIALWPLTHYPPDPDFDLADGEWLVCRLCAEAVRP